VSTGSAIRFQRIKRRRSQRWLALAIGKSTSSISEYESDQHAPSIVTLAAIAQKLGVTTAALLKVKS
jgi:transcriptional regulator with XRE-family HTH domain